MSTENTIQYYPESFTVEVEHGFMAFAESREKCLELIYETVQKYETICALKKTFTTSYHDAGGGHVIYILADSPWNARLKQIIGRNTCGGSFLFNTPVVSRLSGLEEPTCNWDKDDVYMYSDPPEFTIESDEVSVVREWARYDEDVSCIRIFTLTNIFPNLFQTWGWGARHAREGLGKDSLRVRREYDIYPVNIYYRNSTSKQVLYCYRTHLLSEEPEKTDPE